MTISKTTIAVAFALLAGLAAAAEEKMTDEEFSELVNRRLHYGPQTLYAIAYSGHPDALGVLRDLRQLREEEVRPSKWKDFKAKYGYPEEAPDDSYIQVRDRDLEIALAAAGDEAAFERIVTGFEELNSRGKVHVLEDLVKVRTDRAVRFVASQLDEVEGYPELYPFAYYAVAALEQMPLQDPPERRISASDTVEDGMELVQLWKDWWREHAAEYGAAQSSDHLSKPARHAAEVGDLGDVEIATSAEVEKGAAEEKASDQTLSLQWYWIAAVGIVFAIALGYLALRISRR